MSKFRPAFLFAALLVSALVLSACASEPKEKPVAAPTPVEVAAPVEAPPAPVVAPEPAPAPAVVAEQPAPKPKVHKAKKKAAKAKPTVVAPAPVAEPAPVVQPEAPVVKPLAPVVVATPQEKIPEAGFLEKYWLWLLVLVIAIAGIVIWQLMSKGKEQ